MASPNTLATDIISNLSKICFSDSSIVLDTITFFIEDFDYLSIAGPDQKRCLATAITDFAP